MCCAGTRDHDVSQNIAAMLQYIEGEPHFTTLDFDCGPGGETSKSLPKLGHIAGRVEGAAHSADRAPAYSGCEVLVAGILKLDLPDNYFDGVFADAALFHVSSQESPHMLLDPHASLKPGGALFSSNLHGHYEEGWNGGRYDVYYDLAPLCIGCRVR